MHQDIIVIKVQSQEQTQTNYAREVIIVWREHFTPRDALMEVILQKKEQLMLQLANLVEVVSIA